MTVTAITAQTPTSSIAPQDYEPVDLLEIQTYQAGTTDSSDTAVDASAAVATPSPPATGTATSADATQPQPLITGGVAIGVSYPTHDYDIVNDTPPTTLDSYTSAAGTPPATANTFVGWNNASDPENTAHSQIPPGFLESTVAAGVTPMVTWMPGGDIHFGSPNFLDSIISGADDAYIRSMAEQLTAVGSTVLLRFGHEMNLANQYSYAGDPAKYVEAWKHVVDIFRAAGADNVEFVWCPNNGGTNIDGSVGLITPDTAQAYYPGDDYVDVLAFDAYPDPAGNGVNFADLIRDPYNIVAAVSPGKPVMIAETGTGGTEEEKVAFLNSMKASIESGEFTQLQAINYFNFDKKADPNNLFERDWRIEQTPATQAAWADLVGSSAAQGTYTGAPAAGTTLPDGAQNALTDPSASGASGASGAAGATSAPANDPGNYDFDALGVEIAKQLAAYDDSEGYAEEGYVGWQSINRLFEDDNAPAYLKAIAGNLVDSGALTEMTSEGYLATPTVIAEWFDKNYGSGAAADVRVGTLLSANSEGGNINWAVMDTVLNDPTVSDSDKQLIYAFRDDPNGWPRYTSTMLAEDASVTQAHFEQWYREWTALQSGMA